LEAALLAKAQIKRFVMVSSDEVYGQTTDVALDESAPLRPTQPYAATKAAAEMMATAYRLSYGLPIIITRGNNVYGPHQYPEKVIPKFLCLLLRGKPVSLHGRGHSLRSFLYVDDVARAFDLIVHHGQDGLCLVSLNPLK
jgi:UDP-glucose 4,6-dehydratase